MSETIFTSPTPEQRRNILAEYGFTYDKRIRERECLDITSLSRTTRWQFENEGKFPARCHFGRNSCAWLLSDVLWWVRNPPAVTNVNNPTDDPSKDECSGLLSTGCEPRWGKGNPLPFGGFPGSALLKR